jgi:hypothetical protein
VEFDSNGPEQQVSDENSKKEIQTHGTRTGKAVGAALEKIKDRDLGNHS